MTNSILTVYTTYVVSIATMRIRFTQDLPVLILTYLLKSDEYEHLFDWLIQRAYLDLLHDNKFGLQQHYQHDVFEMIYDNHYKYVLPTYIADRLRDIHVLHPSHEKTIHKLMVCGDIVFISKGK
jgi:hypothetical protein